MAVRTAACESTISTRRLNDVASAGAEDSREPSEAAPVASNEVDGAASAANCASTRS